MIISLIGMSGSGKTYWSEKLKDRGFLHICCDDKIEIKLAPVLEKFEYSGIRDISKWLGQPYDSWFKENQQKYMQAEKQVMQEIFDQINDLSIAYDNIVIDATGSVIYTGNEIYKKLKKYTTIIYLKIPRSLHSQMFNVYINDPKPIIWQDMFNKQKNETNRDALKRCYSHLLRHREKLYEQYAHISLNVHELRQNNFTIDDFLKSISMQV